MKQFFSYLGASLAAIAALASCNKEIDAPVEDLKGGVPFEICASTADTKTAIDGEFKTTWVVGATPDSINVYHKLASAAEYTHDGKFLAKTEEGKFSGTLAAAPEAGKEYQWLAKYPYDSYHTTPAEGYSYIGSRSNATQSQTGLNSTDHLSGYYMPLIGKGTSTGTASPTIKMEHASSVIEINVTNNTTEALNVTSIAFTAPESIIGQFVIDYTGETTTYTEKTYASKTATLSVTDGTIAAGESGKFYLAIKPFKATTGQTLKVTVNEKDKFILLRNDVTFSAGKIKTINYSYDNAQPLTVAFASLGYTSWGKTAQFSGNTNDEVTQTQSNVKFTYTRNGSSLYANQNAIRFYKSNTLKFEAPDGYHIEYISWTGSAFKSDVTSDVPSCTSSTSALSWEGEANSVTFTRPSNDDSYATLSAVTVVLGEGTIAKTVSSIAWTGYTTTYKVGDTFKADGTVMATYSDGSTEEVTTKASFSTPDMTTPGTKTVTVTYDGETTTGEITVKDAGSTGGEIVTLFSESFGDNADKAREWNDTYKEQGGISNVYSGATYTITNAKQSKNTVGKTNSGLAQSAQNQDAIFEIKGLNVATYSDLSVSYYWKAGSTKGTYSTSLYYSKDGGTTYTEVEKTSGTGATTFVEVKYTLPADAVRSNLCLKVVFNTSNTQAVIDDFVLKGTN